MNGAPQGTFRILERGFTTPTGVGKCTRFVTVPMDAEQLERLSTGARPMTGRTVPVAFISPL